MRRLEDLRPGPRVGLKCYPAGLFTPICLLPPPLKTGAGEGFGELAKGCSDSGGIPGRGRPVSNLYCSFWLNVSPFIGLTVAP